MDITIIGTGNMSRGIATRALAGGHSVTLLGHEAGKADALASELPGEVGAGTVGDALAGDVVVLAIPYSAIDDVSGTLANGKVAGEALDGRLHPRPTLAEPLELGQTPWGRAVDTGGLARAHELEALGYLR